MSLALDRETQRRLGRQERFFQRMKKMKAPADGLELMLACQKDFPHLGRFSPDNSLLRDPVYATLVGIAKEYMKLADIASQGHHYPQHLPEAEYAHYRFLDGVANWALILMWKIEGRQLLSHEYDYIEDRDRDQMVDFLKSLKDSRNFYDFVPKPE